jgi:hypothetical protein
VHRARLKLSKTDVAVQVSYIVMCFVNSHLKPQFFRCHNELGIDQVQHPGADHMALFLQKYEIKDFKLEDDGKVYITPSTI